MQALYKSIYDDPQFHAIERQRGQLNWSLASMVFVIYFSFILIIAFVPEFFARPIFADSTMNIGILAGLAVIVISLIFTAIYVYVANNFFDEQIKQLILRHTKDEH